MTISTRRMTAAEFLELPPDGIRNELVHGEIVLMSQGRTFDHGYAVTKLIALLARHAETAQLGDIYSNLDCYFGPEDVRRPDLLYFAEHRVHLISADKKPDIPPDLCVEVLSPSSAGYDRTEKFDTYQAAAVPFYWIVDPMERTLEAYKLVNGVYLRSGHGTGGDFLKLPPFETLSIPLATLWRPTIPSKD